MRWLVRRAFDVAVPAQRAWDHLATPSAWPSWARHIRSVETTPPGPVGPDTEGRIRLTNGVRSRFRMVEYVPGERWTWVGRFLWLRVRYEHAFDRLAPDRTRIRFDVGVSGLGSGSLGRLFASIYAKNLDRAIPNLVAELEGTPSAAR
jgi:hypothetical protein